jgi:hypothetical protein
MTDWIDYFVYVLFILSVFFVYPWTSTKLTGPMLADRNANWVTENPGAVRRAKKISHRLLWLHLAFGTASLLALTTLQLGFWFPTQPPDSRVVAKWLVLWQVSMASLYIGMLVFGAIGVASHLILKRKVPVAERREANLERRYIGDFVPLWVRLTTYSLVVAIFAAWTVVAVLGLYNDPTRFWTRFVLLIGLSVFFWLGTSAAIGRRPNAMDRLFGPDNRRGEVLLTFSTQLLPPIIGAVRLYEELSNVIVFDINRAMFLGLALFIAAWLLWIGRQTAANLPPGNAVYQVPQLDSGA